MNGEVLENFFKVPHEFEECYGDKLRPSEKYFFIVLLKLLNRYGDKDGWFWHVDKTFKTKEGNILGFESFGFSVSTSKRARRKLKELGLLETKYGWNKKGYRAGTYYKLKYPLGSL
jgi:hypothetical protein